MLGRTVIGLPYPGNEQVFESLSPVCQVHPDAPPFFVIHGRNDTLVPIAEARAFVDKLRASSTAAVAYAEISGAQHAFDIFPSIRSAHVVRGVQRFLDWTYSRAAKPAQPNLSIAG